MENEAIHGTKGRGKAYSIDLKEVLQYQASISLPITRGGKLQNAIIDQQKNMNYLLVGKMDFILKELFCSLRG